MPWFSKDTVRNAIILSQNCCRTSGMSPSLSLQEDDLAELRRKRLEQMKSSHAEPCFTQIWKWTSLDDLEVQVYSFERSAVVAANWAANWAFLCFTGLAEDRPWWGQLVPISSYTPTPCYGGICAFSENCSEFPKIPVSFLNL